MEGCSGKGAVCVTGGTGFIASCLITRLFEQGYVVRATVRSSLDGNKDISYLTGLPGAKERLQIFKADLNEPESFNEAIEGCAGVLHLAHSLDLGDREPEEICSKLNREPSNIAIENDGEGSRENRRKNYTLRAC